MVTNTPVTPFAEVFNTYGERLTNAQLLVRYGFVLDSNENDIIVWDPRDLHDFTFALFDSLPEITTWNSNEADLASMIQRRELSDVGEIEDRSSGRIYNTIYANEDHVLFRNAGDGKLCENILCRLSVAQSLLERLREVLAQWYRGVTFWGESNLVYDAYSHEEDSNGD